MAGLMEGIFGTCSGHSTSAEISCANPFILKQSPRLGVMETSITKSVSFKYSQIFSPNFASCGNCNKPSPCSDKPNSTAEHNIPCDVTPRSSLVLILVLLA